jgi:hypothetical protein
MNDHFVVVDFRASSTGTPTNISKHPKRITAFFKTDDFTTAQCLFGEDSCVTEISLAN